MRAGGHILADVVDHLRETVKPGLSTLEIDEDVEEFIRGKGAVPAFKGYRGFPATVCISINEEVVHGIPSAHRRIKEGDIVGLDLGCIVERSEEHTSELQSQSNLVCRLLLEKKK